jgi:hypothetical protein
MRWQRRRERANVENRRYDYGGSGCPRGRVSEPLPMLTDLQLILTDSGAGLMQRLSKPHEE